MINRKKPLSGILSLALIAGVFANSPQAEAQSRYGTPNEQLARGWNHSVYIPFLNELAAYRNTPPRSATEQAACERFYSRVKSKKQMKISLGLGYYDASEGESFSFQIYGSSGALETVNFGMNATIDIAYAELYRQLFLRPCTGNLQLCGFQEAGPGLFKKRVKSPDGKKIDAVIEVRNASYTYEHALNVGSYSAQQKAKSDSATSWFMNQVGTADLLVYNGHSRKGGGPDFHPPRLRSNLHADYAWYEKNTPGISRLTSALKSAPQKPAAFLLMSCNSDKLFSGKINAAARGLPMASTNAVPPSGSAPTKGALAGMDAFLRFQCEAGFAQELTSDSDTRQFIVPIKM